MPTTSKPRLGSPARGGRLKLQLVRQVAPYLHVTAALVDKGHALLSRTKLSRKR